MDNFDVTQEGAFYSVDDLVNGAQYLLSLDNVNVTEPELYRKLNSALIRWNIGDTAVLPELNEAVNMLTDRLDLLAHPVKDPIRTLVQQHGWESVQDCINGCNELLKTVRTLKNVQGSDVTKLVKATYAATMQRKQSVPVSFNTVDTMCTLYEVLSVAAFTKSGMLDLEVPMYEKHSSGV